MKTILDTIVEHKHIEVLKRKQRIPLETLKEKQLYHRSVVDYAKYMSTSKPNIIAEFKRKSPSKGQISSIINPITVVDSYQKGGAVISSILTDRDFFGGSFKDLERVKNNVVGFPLLRKDFIIDSYQVHEAKAYGADIILLIASILSKAEVVKLQKEAASIGLATLLEIHSEEELDKLTPGISMIGVNNRNLKDFSVDINRSIDLQPKLPSELIQVSESGLRDPSDVRKLFDAGYQAFLMGEHFMRKEDPGQELRSFIQELS